MFDIAWSELGVIAVVALVVIGPKDLPKVLRSVGQWTAKARSMAREFQSGLDDMVRESELDELRKAARQVTDLSIEGEIKKTIDPDGSMERGLDFQNGTAAGATPEAVDTAAVANAAEPTVTAESAPIEAGTPPPDPKLKEPGT